MKTLIKQLKKNQFHPVQAEVVRAPPEVNHLGHPQRKPLPKVVLRVVKNKKKLSKKKKNRKRLRYKDRTSLKRLKRPKRWPMPVQGEVVRVTRPEEVVSAPPSVNHLGQIQNHPQGSPLPKVVLRVVENKKKLPKKKKNVKRKNRKRLRNKDSTSLKRLKRPKRRPMPVQAAVVRVTSPEIVLRAPPAANHIFQNHPQGSHPPKVVLRVVKNKKKLPKKKKKVKRKNRKRLKDKNSTSLKKLKRPKRRPMPVQAAVV